MLQEFGCIQNLNAMSKFSVFSLKFMLSCVLVFAKVRFENG